METMAEKFKAILEEIVDAGYPSEENDFNMQAMDLLKSAVADIDKEASFGLFRSMPDGDDCPEGEETKEQTHFVYFSDRSVALTKLTYDGGPVLNNGEAMALAPLKYKTKAEAFIEEFKSLEQGEGVLERAAAFADAHDCVRCPRYFDVDDDDFTMNWYLPLPGRHVYQYIFDDNSMVLVESDCCRAYVHMYLG